MKLYEAISIGYNAGFHNLGETISYLLVNMKFFAPAGEVQNEVDNLRKEIAIYGYGRVDEDGCTIFDPEVKLTDVLNRINIMDRTSLWFEED